jgi:hypothetical protein
MISFSLLNLIFLLEQNDFSKNDQIIGECSPIIGKFSQIIGECDRILIFQKITVLSHIQPNFIEFHQKNLKINKIDRL